MPWTKDNHPRGGRHAVGPTIHTKLPEELIARVDLVAAAWGVKRSEAIRRLLEAALTSADPGSRSRE